jgi:hypothetical protein
MKTKFVALAAGISALVLGCAADPGTKPHDMSAAQHDAAAHQEMQAAEGHTDQHDPTATAQSNACSAKSG